MNQAMAATVFYGNTAVYPERFMGLAPRYNSMSGAQSSANVLSGGGSGSTNTSIWLVCWGPNTIHGIFPKGSKAGLQHEDLGEQTLQDNNTPQGKYQGYRTHYKWDIGMCFRDWRYAVRVANVDVSVLTKNAASGADLIDLMTQAIELLPEIKMGNPVFYCSRTVRSFLRRQIANKIAAGTLTLEQIAGQHVVSFDGIPVKRCDQILNTEAVVS